MKVTRITLRNVMGIESIEINPGMVTVISGLNGSGKTSIVEGILNLIGGGNCASLIRKGATEGETVIELSDGMILEKSFTEHNFNTVVSMEGREVSAPLGYIKKLFGNGFNPVKFLTMSKADRVAEIIRAIPYSITAEELTQLTGIRFKELDYAQHGTIVLDKARKTIFEQRTAVNTLFKDAQTMITTLQNSTVTVRDNITELVAEANSQIAALNKDINVSEQGKIQSSSTLDLDEQREIAAIQAKYREQKDIVSSDARAYKGAIDLQISDQKVVLAGLEKELETATKAKIAQAQIAEYRNKSKLSDDSSRKLSAALEAIDRVKKDNASNNMIGDMNISIDFSGDLIVDGISFDKINKAKQFHLAMLLAEKNMGELKFALIDGAELLDSEAQKMIEAEAEAGDYQLMMCEVSDAPLSIATHGTIPRPAIIPQPSQEMPSPTINPITISQPITEDIRLLPAVEGVLTGDDAIDYPEAVAEIAAFRGGRGLPPALQPEEVTDEADIPEVA